MKDYYQDSTFESLKGHPPLLGPAIEINIFVDASHADDLLDRKSVTCIMIYIGDILIKSVSKHQKCIATSTFSSEFLALKTAVEEAHSLSLLMQSIGVPLKGPINIHCDSASVLQSAGNPGNKLKRKYVSIAFNFVRESIATNVIKLWKIDGKLNPADVCTKALPRIPWSGHSARLKVNVNEV